jgi:uncharacterized iron-regulated membrane protein
MSGRWIHQPQSVPLRQALFQVHLWAGIGLGLYVVAICLSGSVLVYRNELYRRFSPKPLVLSGSGVPLAADELAAAARRAYPGFAVADARPGATARDAVEVTLQRGDRRLRRLLHPFTGEDLGDPLPLGFRTTAWLLDFHDNLLGGRTGRRVNGVGAVLVLLLSATGAVIWWPGVRQWRRSLTVDVHSSWRRLNWSLHSALGFWFLGFIAMWGVTGAYLAFPEAFAATFDAIEPFDEADPGGRIVDSVQYWLAYLHFGRLGGRGIPGCGRGVCDMMSKAVWAAAGLVPAAMAVSGALMWWSRVIRPSARRRSGEESALFR